MHTATREDFEAATFPAQCERCDDWTATAQVRSTDPRDQIGVSNMCWQCIQISPARIVKEW
jgi:hypothetical protein